MPLLRERADLMELQVVDFSRCQVHPAARQSRGARDGRRGARGREREEHVLVLSESGWRRAALNALTRRIRAVSGGVRPGS